MEWLTSSAIELGGSTVSWLELFGAVTGLASVWWAARERVWTWPIGIVNSVLFLLLFLDVELYATALLQLGFIGLGIYGWREWVRGGPTDDELPVRRTTRNEWLGLALATAVAQAGWTGWLVVSTDSTVAFWDSAVLVLSLAATFGQARKLIESWWIWIVVDTISIPLFLSKGLVATAILYVVFEALCIVGLRDWKRSMRARARRRAGGRRWSRPDVTGRTAHGLIIGKCYPPHAGHELLVRTAAAVSDRVTVLILAHPDEVIALDDRVAWLAAAVRDLRNVTVAGGDDPHPIDYDDPTVWDLHEAEFRRTLAGVTDEPVTAVFSSEPYGAELARRFGATSVCVDPDRSLVPVSASAVRADPVATWEWLPAPVRAGLARRVVMVGAESTGKTTLCRDIAGELRARGGAHGLTRWVPEVGRARTIELQAVAAASAALSGRPPPTMADLEWPSAEFVAIAAAQNAREDVEALVGGPVLVCDTDAFATGIWHERYVGHRDAAVDDLARHHDLYLVSHHDGAPFVQDGIRDGEHIRAWMTDRFIDELTATDRRFVVLTGSWDHREEVALSAIDDLLAAGRPFSPGSA